ncbi:hypothetical protein JD793_001937 [Citrobacter braakii]|uniref:DUF6708 domain-containing protein n=1 Tax=Citrobacter TaxID=544 RepID=UPI0006433769|nr:MULTISPECIES: DUF6708 domain-containing protein [Citrobacter]EGT5655818.1 hypothetical protein [Citrobacter braakii]KLQ21881.1 hypothetical protein ABR34_13805 [Citrobacter braakii]OCF81261.1 hypothetical protein AS299_06775 [Citrobacter freundii]QLV67129.1 hypothetical protein HV237_03905 [Citrobacter sp. RHBSTW-00570]
MAISHTLGLYIPFKLNRPLTKEEKQSCFVQGKRRKGLGEAAVLDLDTVIRMNSSYLEVVDKFYPVKGVIAGPMMCMLLFITGISSWFYWVAMFSMDYKGGVVGCFMVLIALLFFIFLFGRPLLKDWLSKTHYPVRFNRKNQLVYIFQVKGEVITLPWKDIYFTTSKQKVSYCIVGHVLAEDKETVLNTFSFGHVGQKTELSLYWEFIRCYMEEDCLPELAKTVFYCPPVEKQKEGYITGLQTLMKMDSRLEWIPNVLLFPLTLVESIARYIGMQTSKIPQWPQEVLEACAVDSNDPINIGAENNPPHRWRTVLAHEMREAYDAKNQHLKSVNQEIKEKLDKKYGTVS